uniref:L-fucokinase domain-containing protein n=1 Tax=Meloidogyne javanica TaxID=6303 RepID=A0A915N982_MELJA
MKIAPKSVNKEICKANENVSSSESDLSSFEDKMMEDDPQIEDDEQEEEDECDNQEECSMSDDEIAALRSTAPVKCKQNPFILCNINFAEISSFSLKKLAELKSKIGFELFNKIMYGKSISSFNEDNSNKIQSKKSGGTHDYQDQKLKEDILSDLRRTNIERMNNGERPIYLNNSNQRIPHVALTGKAFMLMPDGKTLFEHKLIAYRKLLNSFSNFGGFLFITSADVLEYFPNDFCISNIPKEISLFLIAHQSNLDVATQHGVYVLKEKGVYNVLQKPSIEQLKEVCGAILEPNEFSPFETALTDSCYIIGPELIENLIKNRKENGEVICELCCYRDFLCPIGSAPNEEKMTHFIKKNVELFKWQQILWLEQEIIF